jgi:hypothetical protein
MNAASKLTGIKILHTIIWIFFNLVIGYLAYAVAINKIDRLVLIGISIIVAEGFILLLFKLHCPLTIMARRYSRSMKDNFDIFLPEWLAKYNKLIYMAIFFIIVAGLVYRTWMNAAGN